MTKPKAMVTKKARKKQATPKTRAKKQPLMPEIIKEKPTINAEHDAPQPLLSHLNELKKRLFWCVLAYISAVCLCFTEADTIYQFLVEPLKNARADNSANRLIFTSLTEPFTTYLKLAFFAGFIMSFPILAWHGYRFLAPGLYKNEQRVIWPFLLASPILFGLGAALAYYYVFPAAWTFFLGFEILPGMSDAVPIMLEARIAEYLNLTTDLIIAFGVAFQLPVLLILLSFAGLLSATSLKTKRKYAIILIFIVAGILTPPDVISQIGLAIPLLLLYEISVYICAWLETPKVQNNA
jgi:sec-independent protein translocase protein TatC